jgi:hypothetical protein
MASRLSTLRPTTVPPTIHMVECLYLAAAVGTLLIVGMLLVGAGRMVRDALSTSAVSRAADGCIIESTYVPTTTSYTVVPALVCWGPDDNLQVISPRVAPVGARCSQRRANLLAARPYASK